MNPWQELRAFANAALVRPVSSATPVADERLRHVRLVSSVTLVAGAVVLALALSIAPGDPWFYPATLGLAAVWLIGGLLAGRVRLGRAHTRAGATARPWVQSVVLGFLLLAVFLAGALVVAKIPVLRGPVEDLLDHARFGALPVVLAITVVNGIAEEVFFRGALFDAFAPRYAVAASTALYTLTTVGSGVPLLVFAAAVIGVITGLQRRVTGGVLGPILTHVVWSSGMLLLLPPVLARFA